MAVLLTKNWQQLGSTSFSANDYSSLQFVFYGRYQDVSGEPFKKDIQVYTSVYSPGYYRLKSDVVHHTVAGSSQTQTFTFKSSGSYSAPSDSESDIANYTSTFRVSYDMSTGTWSGSTSCYITFSYTDSGEVQGCYTFNSSDEREGFSGQTKTMSNTLQLPNLVRASVSVSSAQSYAGTAAGGGSFWVGQTATVTATPNMLFKFANWTNGTSQVSTDASYSFTVNGDTSLLANFELDPNLARRYIIVT